MPKAGEARTGDLPESFDAVAALLEMRFGRLAAEIRQMRKALGEAEERSERLRQKLLSSEWLHG